jgi:hypothetical protein
MGAVVMMSILVLITAGALVLPAWIFKTVSAKLIAEDVRAMVDDLPGVIMEVAIRRLSVEMREYYRPEFEDDLIAFTARYNRYPTRKLLKTTGFAISLLIGAARIRKETQPVYLMGKQDERNERLAPLVGGKHPTAMIGPIQLQYRTREVVFREAEDGSFKLDLKTPSPSDSDVTIIDEEDDDVFTVIVRQRGLPVTGV